MPTPDLPKVELAIVQLTNEFRKELRLGVVVANAVLRKSAEAYARYLATSGQFSHTADGRQPGERAKAGGYEYCIVSENLSSNLDSRGFETRQLARDAVEGWKGSPGHRKNMVEPHVTEIAVAVAKAPGEERYISVQLFGRPITHRYEFTVTNASELPVAYTFAGRSFTIEQLRIITHTECVPGALTFVSAGSWLTKQSLTQSFAVGQGTGILIEADAGAAKIAIREVKSKPAAAPPAATAAKPQPATAVK